MRIGQALVALALTALIVGCGATGEADRQATAPTADLAAQALAAYAEALDGPATGAALRRSFDQVELALAVVPPDHGRRGELLAAEGDLAGRLAQLAAQPAAPTAQASDPTPAPELTATPTADPTAAAAARPAAPRPARPPSSTYTVTTRKSFEGSGASGQFASCIDVQILGRDGPVAGAVLGINNGEHSYQDQTDQNGYSGRCGLGASTWSVVLFWTPGAGQVRGAATTVYLSGAPEQRAAVVFQEP